MKFAIRFQLTEGGLSLERKFVSANNAGDYGENTGT